MERKKICPKCDGTGIANILIDRKIGSMCPECKGKGYIFKKSSKNVFKAKKAIDGIETVHLIMTIPQQDEPIYAGEVDYESFYQDKLSSKNIIVSDYVKSRICPAYFEKSFHIHKKCGSVLCSHNERLSLKNCPFESWQKLDTLGISYCWDSYEKEGSEKKINISLTPSEYDFLCHALTQSSVRNLAYRETLYALLSLRRKLDFFPLKKVSAYKDQETRYARLCGDLGIPRYNENDSEIL